MKVIFFIVLCICIISCEVFYIQPHGSGDCSATWSPCTIAKALGKLNNTSGSATLLFSSGEYQVSGITTNLYCSSFKMVANKFVNAIISFEEDVTPFLHFNNDVKIEVTRLLFNNVKRTIFSSSKSSNVDLSLNSVNFTSGESHLFRSSRLKSLALTSVYVNTWSNGFIEVEENDIPCSITAKTVHLTHLTDICPFLIEADIFNPKSAVTVDLQDFKLEDSQNQNPSVTAGLQITSNSISVTLSHFSSSSASSSVIDLHSLTDLTFNVYDNSKFSYIPRGPISLRSDWTSITVDIKDTEFSNNTNIGGGAISAFFNHSISYSSSNSKYLGNRCVIGGETGGGAISLFQIDESDVPSTVTIKDDYYEGNVAEGEGMNGGVFWLGVKKLQLNVENSVFLFNSAVRETSRRRRRSINNNEESSGGGVMFVREEKTNLIRMTLSGNIFVENSAGFDGGVVSMDGPDDSSYKYNISLTKNLFLGNIANSGYGGAGDIWKATGKLEMNLFKGNEAKGGPGGALLWVEGDSLELGEGNVFDGNYAKGDGGALYVSTMDRMSILEHNLVTRNRANVAGGGISVRYVGEVEVKSDIVANSAVYGGGMFVLLSGTENVKLFADVTDNEAELFGGGVYVQCDDEQSGTFQKDEFIQHVKKNKGGNLMSPPISLQKNEQEENTNLCEICGKKKDMWCCQVFDLQFLDLFGDVLIKDTLDPFFLTFEVGGTEKGSEKGIITVATKETTNLGFSFLPSTKGLSVKSLSGEYEVDVEFGGTMVSILMVFGKSEPEPKTTSYLWIPFVCLAFCCCCCCCFVCFVFGVICIGLVSFCCVGVSCFSFGCLNWGVISGFCCGCWSVKSRKKGVKYQGIVDHREESINRVNGDVEEKISILARENEDRSIFDDEEETNITIDQDEIEENMKQTGYDDDSDGMDSDVSEEENERRDSTRGYQDGYDEL